MKQYYVIPYHVIVVSVNDLSGPDAQAEIAGLKEALTILENDTAPGLGSLSLSNIYIYIYMYTYVYQSIYPWLRTVTRKALRCAPVRSLFACLRRWGLAKPAETDIGLQGAYCQRRVPTPRFISSPKSQ